MEDLSRVLHALLHYPHTDVNLEIHEQTACSIAAEGGNWKVVEELMSHGATPNHPALIQALALNNHLLRLEQSLKIEEGLAAERRLLTGRRLGDIFSRTCKAGHAECAYTIRQHMQRIGVKEDGQHTLLDAVRQEQHWMIPFYLTTSHLTEASLGEAILTSAQHGDYRSE